MTQEQIIELVNRYLNGETTLAEERELFAYFRGQEDLPQSLLPYRQMMLDMGAADGTEKDEESLFAELSNRESRSVGWWRYAAIVVGIVLLTGIAYAAYRTHLFTQSWSSEEAIAEQIGDEMSAPDPSNQYTIYDNVHLDSILDEMGHFYHLKVEYGDPSTRDIRLYFRWDRTKKVDEVVDMLNHFQQIKIRREKGKLIVGEK